MYVCMYVFMYVYMYVYIRDVHGNGKYGIPTHPVGFPCMGMRTNCLN